MSLLTGGLVLAEEEARGGLLDAYPGLAFWFLVTFIVVAVILRWKVWGPLGDAISAREKSIQDAVDQAKKAAEDAEKLVADAKAREQDARKEAAETLRRGLADFEKMKEQAQVQARAEAEIEKREARKQIEEEKRKALAEIRDLAVELAIGAAGKLVAQRLDDSAQKTLADEFIADIQRSGTRPQNVA